MTDKSRLAQAIEARPRKAYEFEVQGFLGLGSKVIHKVAIRINSKKEQDSAILAAHMRINSEASGDAVSARQDNELLTDAKTIEALFSACRRCEEGDQEQSYRYPAFPGPQWMRENLTTDQLAILLNLYNEVRKHESPYWQPLSFEQIEILAELCTANFENDVPEAVLGAFDREYLTQAFVLLARRWHENRHQPSPGGEPEADFEPSQDEPENEDGARPSSGEGEIGASLPEPNG